MWWMNSALGSSIRARGQDHRLTDVGTDVAARAHHRLVLEEIEHRPVAATETMDGQTAGPVGLIEDAAQDLEAPELVLPVLPEHTLGALAALVEPLLVDPGDRRQLPEPLFDVDLRRCHGRRIDRQAGETKGDRARSKVGRQCGLSLDILTPTILLHIFW